MMVRPTYDIPATEFRAAGVYAHKATGLQLLFQANNQMFHTRSRRADNQTPHRSAGYCRTRLADIKYTEFAPLTHPECRFE